MTATLVSQMGVAASLSLYSDTGGSISLKCAATDVARLVGYTSRHLRDINGNIDEFGAERTLDLWNLRRSQGRPKNRPPILERVHSITIPPATTLSVKSVGPRWLPRPLSL